LFVGEPGFTPAAMLGTKVKGPGGALTGLRAIRIDFDQIGAIRIDCTVYEHHTILRFQQVLLGKTGLQLGITGLQLEITGLQLETEWKINGNTMVNSLGYTWAILRLHKDYTRTTMGVQWKTTGPDLVTGR
jgi:hypothetical protein